MSKHVYWFLLVYYFLFMLGFIEKYLENKKCEIIVFY